MGVHFSDFDETQGSLKSTRKYPPSGPTEQAKINKSGEPKTDIIFLYRLYLVVLILGFFPPSARRLPSHAFLLMVGFAVTIIMVQMLAFSSILSTLKVHMGEKPDTATIDSCSRMRSKECLIWTT